MVIGNPDANNAAAPTAVGGLGLAGVNAMAHPSGIPQDQIDNIMSGIANTGDVKMNNHRKKLRQRFDIIKKLGQGTYGKVQLGINKETGQEVAIKTIKKCKIEAEADLVRIRREVQIMSSVQHPNIIHIYEVFENREKMVLVMEFAAGGELYDYLSVRKVLSEEEARRIFRQVATAVYYCHKHKICHRDLKLENILLDERGNAKIADFGLSNVFDDQRLLATFCGSPLYASPEIVEGTPYQGPEVDCWSLGVLLYTLVYGSMPFDGSNFKRLVKQISQGDYYEPKKPSRASSLIRDMLTVCPRKRATIEQICSHWWVNENDNVSCLDLAEDLANQTPVRLDVLLSLTPTAITADQLVVPSADGSAAGKGGERVPRSHSVGSIRDMGANTEAERRILDMVAAGGEAALMPSPTRTITPAQSPVQTKRKLETTISMENAALKKKEKPAASGGSLVFKEIPAPLIEESPMQVDEAAVEESQAPAVAAASSFSRKDMKAVRDLCEKLIQDKPEAAATEAAASSMPSESLPRQKTVGKLDSVDETPEEKDPTKVIKKFVNKHKTADLVNAIGQLAPEKGANEPVAAAAATSGTPIQATTTATTAPALVPTATATATATAATPAPFVRKCSLQDDSSLSKFNAEQRRKSRILETAEKFQQMNAGSGGDKPKKFVIPGVSVGSFKKEFERKASTTTPAQQGPTAGERRAQEQVAAAAAAAQELEGSGDTGTPPTPTTPAGGAAGGVESCDSKTSVTSISLEDARRSMENSIALLRQAQHESSKEVDQLCAQTESIGVSDDGIVEHERERKLKNARAIIGNAIQPVIRRPKPFSGYGGGGYEHTRAASGGFMGYDLCGSSSGGGDGYDGGDDGGGGGGGGVGVGGGRVGGGSLMSLPADGVGGMSNGMFHLLTRGGASPQSRQFATPSPSPSLPQLHSSMLLPPQTPQLTTTTSANVAALAAARQTIMERLAGGSVGVRCTDGGRTSGRGGHYQQQGNMFSLQPNSLSTNAAMHAPNPALYISMFSPHQHQPSKTKLLQQQQTSPGHQHQHQHQHHNHHHHHHHLSYATTASASVPVATAYAPVATAVHANTKVKPIKSNTTSTATSTTTNSVPKPFYNAPAPSQLLKSSPGGGDSNPNPVKTSTASITLKSATLPRRKTAKTEIQLEIKPRTIPEQQPQPQPGTIRFTTEMQHPVADLRSAPPREGPVPYSPIKAPLNARATSLEPKEHIIPIQRPQPAYSRTTSNTTNRSGSLSRQSTGDSESDTTTNMSQSTITGSSQPIKKSPREFIIPIAVEGGGFITPREGSIEPSESSHTTSSRSTFSRLRPTRRIGSLLNDSGVDEGLPFQKMRTASINKDVGDDDGRFTLHRLRSSRPVKKISQDNDSQSSGEEDDDDDGFEILTAENLFSTLLQRVRALTNRMNVNNDLTTGFPNSTRLLNNLRQAQSPFWNQEPFGRRLNNTGSGVGAGVGAGVGVGVGAPWRHSMSRDLGSDMESMFSRTGATLPRGEYHRLKSKFLDH